MVRKMHKHRGGALMALAVVALFAAVPANPQVSTPRAPMVLTGTQATYSLAKALTAGTPIEVVNVPADGRQLTLLKDYIERRKAELAPTFARATAAVTLTNALPGDPLYRFARAANIRIVDIDAAVPWTLDRPGVALAVSPVSNVAWGEGDAVATDTAPYFWLSVSNAIRMGDIVGHDLAALFPDFAAAIAKNGDELKRSLLALRNEYHNRLIAAGDDVVFALTGDFVYLTNDLGLLVDGYFIKQDVRWTADDLANLTAHLTERGIKVVIHRWLPSGEIQNAVRAGGAALVVLDTGDPGLVEEDALAADGLQRILRSDLEAVVTAFTTPSSRVEVTP
jgi:ABC-type Zn uptake system ZnuABC Zn-binding protein ZnuA